MKASLILCCNVRRANFCCLFVCPAGQKNHLKGLHVLHFSERDKLPMRCSALFLVAVAAVFISTVSAFIPVRHMTSSKSAVPSGHRVRRGFGGNAGNVTIVSCPSDFKCAGASCESYSYGSGACLSGGSAGGAAYTCRNSLATCLTALDYSGNSPNATACSPATLADNAAIVCDFCYSIPIPVESTTLYGKVVNCQDNTKRTLMYDCDANCANCKNQVKAPLNTCVKNPFSGGFTSITGTTSCKKTVTFTQWANSDCSGNVTANSAIQANQCEDAYEYGQSSTVFRC